MLVLFLRFNKEPTGIKSLKYLLNNIVLNKKVKKITEIKK